MRFIHARLEGFRSVHGLKSDSWTVTYDGLRALCGEKPTDGRALKYR